MYRISLFVFILFAGSFAWSKHDLSYYLSHPDDASKKIRECDAAMEKAFIDKDGDKLNEISADSECKAAQKAHKEYKRQQYREKQRAREKAKADAKNKYEQEFQRHKKRLAAMGTAEFFAQQQQACAAARLGRVRPPACKAFNDLKASKTKAAVNELLNKYDSEQLLAYKKKKCSAGRYDVVNCGFAGEAMKKRLKEKLEYYSSNPAALKSVFNQCQRKYKSLKKKGKHKEAMHHIRTFRCNTARTAAKKLKVYDFSKPMT